MNLDYLNMYAEKFLKENYNLSLKIPLMVNNRLRSSLGSFITDYKDIEARRIELSGDLLKYGTQNVILDVLKHELIHYALFLLEKPSRDGDVYFEEELRRLKVSSSSDPCHVGIETVIKCSKCGMEFESPLKSVYKNPKRYKASCCMERLIIVGRKVYDGEKAYMIEQIV